jgi:hypothetical protein
MRRHLIAGFVALGVVGSLQSGLSACGDKFLLVGRGAGFGRVYAALYPASILMFAATPSGKATTISDSRFAKALKQAGHRVQVVTTAPALADALAGGGYDIVLAPFSDAVAVDRRLGTTLPLRPMLLPMLYKPDSSELTSATRQFGTVLKGPDRMSHFLAQIDDVMKTRLNAARTANGH